MPSDSPQSYESLSLSDRSAFGAPTEPEPVSALFGHYLRVIWQQSWKILLFVLAATALAYFVSKRIAPIYESTASVDIDRRSPTGVVGAAAQQSAGGDSEQYIATQVRLMQSASVLRPVVEQYHLAGDPVKAAQPKGAITLPGLKVAHVPGTDLITITYRAASPETAADVANAVAESYIRHNYEMRADSSSGLSKFMSRQIEELRVKMDSSNAALVNFSKQLNFVNPEEKTNVLTSRLLQTNNEYMNAQNERVKREAALNAVRVGSLEAAQTSAQGENTRKLADRLQEAEQRFTKVQAVYGKRHPEYISAQTEVALLKQALGNSNLNTLRRVQSEYQEALGRERMLKRSVDDLKAEVDAQATQGSVYQSKLREAEGDRKLYEELVRKIKEASINAGFDNNSVRLADPAQPVFTAVSPNLRNNVLVALMLSLFFSIGAAILTDTMDTTVRNPDAITRGLNTEVLGMLPLVRQWQAKAHAPAALPFHGEATGTVAEFEETVRSLRNSILLGGTGERPRALLFTSAAPEEGKTTTAVHMAVAHAMQGHRTLLIDADLRRPGVQKWFGASPTGLADVITSGTGWESTLTEAKQVPGLFILPAGTPSSNAASQVERVMPAILHEAREKFGLVVVDAPPLLGFSEPLQIASLVDRVIIVARAGQTDRNSIGVMLNTLKRLRAGVSGVVLNGVSSEVRNRYQYQGTYAAYQKHYGTQRIG